jgi:hypothetical protein
VLLEAITLLAAVLLIPLVPAFILYKLLPSKAAVKGPFKGLDIALQGAFGGYFVLVLVAFGVMEAVRPDPSDFPLYEEYDLSGTAVLGDSDPDDLDPRLFRMFLHPRVERVEGPFGPNRFEWATKLPLRRERDDKLIFPYETIVLEYPGFFTEQVEIRSGEVQERERKITFADVELHSRESAEELVRSIPPLELDDAQ